MLLFIEEPAAWNCVLTYYYTIFSDEHLGEIFYKLLISRGRETEKSLTHSLLLLFGLEEIVMLYMTYV